VGDGALRQDRIETDVRAVVGDPSWTDYTLTLKARKLGGQEGFLILFHSPNLDDPTWWNIGGWNNTSHAIQESQFPETHVEGSIENDRWYDIRVELAGGSVKAYLDDKLIHAAEAATAYQLYAAAGVDEAAGELVVELVNPTDRPCDTKMELTGFGSATTDATAVTLTAESPQSENSLEQPERVAPQTSTITGVAAEFRHRVPPHAIQVLRIPVSR
jgi:alpha-L-arabinofuranosidase